VAASGIGKVAAELIEYSKIKIQVREYLLEFRLSRVIFTGILVFFRGDDW